MKEMDKFKIGLVLIGIMCISAASYIILSGQEQHQPQGTITISRSCFENGNEVYLTNNHVLKSCDIDINCFGIADEIYVGANIFDCDGKIEMTFTNSSRILVQGNLIMHNINFLEIEEFVFRDIETMDKMTIRGN